MDVLYKLCDSIEEKIKINPDLINQLRNRNEIKNVTELDNLYINNIENICAVKADIETFFNNIYKYNFYEETFKLFDLNLAVYFKNLFYHYDPIAGEYDKYKLLKQYFRNGNLNSPRIELEKIPFDGFLYEEIYKIIKKYPQKASPAMFAYVVDSKYYEHMYEYEIPMIKLLSEEDSVENMYIKLQTVISKQNFYDIYENFTCVSHVLNNLKKLSNLIKCSLAWRDYYIQYNNNHNKSFNIKSIQYGLLFTIAPRKLHLLYNLFDILYMSCKYIKEFMSKNSEIRKSLANFYEFLRDKANILGVNVNSDDEAFMKIFTKEYNSQYCRISKMSIENQFTKYLNEVAIGKISPDNPLNYDNTIEFFKKLIEEYFTISKKAKKIN